MSQPKTLFTIFLNNTTVKGVSHASQAKNAFSRVLWIVTSIFGLVVAVMFLHLLLTQYTSHEMSTGISEQPGFAPFPAVTLCNFNPLAYYEHSSHDFEEVLDEIEKKIELIEKNDSLSADHKRTIKWVLLRLETFYGFFQNADDHYVNDKLEPSRFIFDCNLFGSSYNNIFYQCQDLFKHVFLNADIGSCFTINPQEIYSAATNYTHADFGNTTAINVVVYLNEFFNVPNPDFSPHSPLASGVRMILHEPGVLPYATNAVSLYPGTYTKIVIDPIYRSRLPPPYTRCEHRKFVNETVESYEYDYSQEGCFEACRQSNVVKRCRCVEASIFSTLRQRKLYPFCGNISNAHTNLVDNVNCLYNAINRMLCYKSCPTVCEEYQYKFKSFASKWPSPVNQLAFYKHYLKESIYKDKFTIYEDIARTMAIDRDRGFQMLRSTDLITRNCLQIQLSLGRPVTVHMVDKPVISLAAFIGGIGGTFNLWVGLSFVTFVEVLDVFICLVNSFHTGRTKKVEQIDNEDTTPVVL